MFWSVLLWAPMGFSKAQPRVHYVRADIKKYTIPRVQPKKYVYNAKTGTLTEYTYNKLLPSQVTLRTKPSAKKYGVGVQLRPLTSMDSKKITTTRRLASASENKKK